MNLFEGSIEGWSRRLGSVSSLPCLHVCGVFTWKRKRNGIRDRMGQPRHMGCGGRNSVRGSGGADRLYGVVEPVE